MGVTCRRSCVRLYCLRSSPPIRSRASSMTTELPRMAYNTREAAVSIINVGSVEHSRVLFHTTMPRGTFSPPSFSSNASPTTMFRKTYERVSGLTPRRDGARARVCAPKEDIRETYIVATQNTDDLAAAVQLNKHSLVQVLISQHC